MLLRRLTHRRPVPEIKPSVLACNLSFVLHEPSDSQAVEAAVSACQSHAAWLWRVDAETLPLATVHGQSEHDVDIWLTATLGLHTRLEHALAEATRSTAPVMLIDDPVADAATVLFFRATASLVLPDDRERLVGVAGLVTRPGRRDTQLNIEGTFAWPLERDEVLRCLERLVQRDAGQWVSRRALWDAPAEVMLSDEVR